MSDMTRSGRAYDLCQPSHNAQLTEVGKGTPMGELLRRYWLPVGLSSYATDLPRMVRSLGDDYVLFRDGRGKAGLVHPRCCHRGSSLFFGRVEEFGIRCCYHGWLFDIEGHCLEMPAEPGGKARGNVRQPWVPVDERYGLIWAYFGPADRQPQLPRYDVLEILDVGEQLFTDDSNLGAVTHLDVVPFNWLQHYENVHDPAHVFWLHYLHSGPQFGERFGEVEIAALKAALPDIVAGARPYPTGRGIAENLIMKTPDGMVIKTVIETVFPTLRVVPSPRGKLGRVDHIGFVLPIDDTSFKIFTVYRGTDRLFLEQHQARNKSYGDLTQEQRQRFPSDLEAQGSLGPITLHSEEHLTRSDAGIVAVRRLFENQVEAVMQGRDPIGTCFTPGEEMVEIIAGTFIENHRSMI